MTKNSFDKFRDVGSPLTEWTIPSEDGVHRRTIVKGAAWTIPVVAVAVATPAAAASKTPTLAFTQASYSGTGCGTIKGAQVKRTTDGTTADPGKMVTVTLTDGYTFKDGTKTYSGTTDASGLITLPDITVPAQGGSSSFKASSDSLAASAPVSGTKKTTIRQYEAGVFTDYSTIPGASSLTVSNDSTAAGSPYVLTSDGTLYLVDGTKPAIEVAKNVKDFSPYLSGGNSNGVYYIDSSGVVKQYEGGTYTTYTTITNATEITVSNDSKAAGKPYVLTSDGTLYLVNGTNAAATEVAKNVKDFSPYLSGGNSNGVYYIDSSGVVKQYEGGTYTTYTTITNATEITVSNDSKAAGKPYVLTSDGTLYLVNGTNAAATEVAKNVKDFSPYLSGGTSNGVYYIDSSGVVKQYAGGTYTTYSTITNATEITVSNDSKAAGSPYVLTSDGTLYLVDGTKPAIEVAKNVEDFSPYLSGGNSNGVYFIQNATTC